MLPNDLDPVVDILDIRYYYDLTREYEYDPHELLDLGYEDLPEFNIVGNLDSPNINIFKSFKNG